ncbi:uncharacterized protein [Eurosta solidaginis]|uniref:uncharacterized protein n=1 Tax=Eurosta solidaginis TaxID=178769 RepID=UPI00353125E9
MLAFELQITSKLKDRGRRNSKMDGNSGKDNKKRRAIKSIKEYFCKLPKLQEQVCDDTNVENGSTVPLLTHTDREVKTLLVDNNTKKTLHSISMNTESGSNVPISLSQNSIVEKYDIGNLVGKKNLLDDYTK